MNPFDQRDISEAIRRGYAMQNYEDSKAVSIEWGQDLFNPDDNFQKLIDDRKNGVMRGLSTGWKALDEYYTVKPGQMTVITGYPGSGKSEFLDALVLNLMVEHTWTVAIFSPENMPREEHVKKFVEKFVGKPFYKNQENSMTDAEAEEGIIWFNERMFFVEPAIEPTYEVILKCFEMIHAEKKINAVIIDPYNEIEHKRPYGMTETEYISQFLGRVRRMARSLNIHFFIIAHPTKLPKENGKYPVPTAYDIAGSSNWRNKADVCITVHRDIYTEDEIKKDTVEIHIQKVRSKLVGKIGFTTLSWDRASGRFGDNTTLGLPPAPYKQFF